MTPMLVTSLVTALISLAAILYLLWPQRSRMREAAGAIDLDNLFPVHSHHLPQLRQALLPYDDLFIGRRFRASGHRAWRAERRRVVHQFLAGLVDDFVRLEHLSRAIAALSPGIKKEYEFERVWLALRFSVLSRLVQLRLVLGFAVQRQIVRLTQLLGTFASQLAASMTDLEQPALAGSPTLAP